jgi:hypothetical protein
MARKRFSEMSVAELEAIDNSDRYLRGRADAFDHGNPETVLDYWHRETPDDTELRAIVKNILERLR